MSPSNRKPSLFTVAVAFIALLGRVAPNQIAGLAAFLREVKLVFVCYRRREIGAALKEAGVDSVYYESPNTAHEWQTWRLSLREFAPLLFQDQ